MPQGSIVTFYSFKGGVGRSFVLANIAALLAQWGYRVLCVDWDLEAPGLNHYFARWLKTEPARGLVDLVHAFAAGRKPRWGDYTTSVRLPRSRQPVALVVAGAVDEDYAGKVQALDWNRLYEKSGFGTYIEESRTKWKREYDFVFIDSRTGISDTAGITTVQLPDILATVLTANNQSIEGVYDVVTRAIAARQRLQFVRSRLLILPIVSRFELRVEFKVGTTWLQKIERHFEGLYGPWLPRSAKTSEILKFTRVPHVPFWNFGEQLPVVVDRFRDDDPESVNYMLQNIAALLANGLAEADQLIFNRDSYLARSVRVSKPRQNKSASTEQVVFLSAPRPEMPFAEQLKAALRAKGTIVIGSDEPAKKGADFKQDTLEGLRRANFLVAIFDGERSSFQHSEIEAFVSLSLREGGVNRIIPIIRTDEAMKTIPRVLCDLVSIDARSAGPRACATKLVKLMRSSYGEATNQERLHFV